MAYKDKLEEKIGNNEFNIDRTLKDIEVLKLDDRDLRADYNALVLEKEALERHAKILINQNDELTRELEMFVQTDEVLRSQLDRKARLNDLSYKISSDNERVRAKIDYVRSISRSRSPVYERSRSPVYERSRSPPVYERVVYDKKYATGSLRSPTRGDLKTTAATKSMEQTLMRIINQCPLSSKAQKDMPADSKLKQKKRELMTERHHPFVVSAHL